MCVFISVLVLRKNCLFFVVETGFDLILRIGPILVKISGSLMEKKTTVARLILDLSPNSQLNFARHANSSLQHAGGKTKVTD